MSIVILQSFKKILYKYVFSVIIYLNDKFYTTLLKISGENSFIDRSYTDNLSSMRDLSLQTNLLLNRDQTPNKELDLL